MTLADMIVSDGLTVFMDDDDFAESVTYYPAAGGSRTIKAVVNRNPPAAISATGEVIQYRFTISVHNNSTTGISSSEFNSGGDAVELPLQVGESVARVALLVLMSNDTGCCEFAA